MFKCAVCGQVSEQGEKPTTVVIGTRPVSYHNEYESVDEYGNVTKRSTDSIGTEITGAIRVCRADAKVYGIDIAAPKTQTIQLGAHTFEEPLVSQLKRPLIDLAVHNTLHYRLEHKSKRATRDNAVSIPLIKGFVDRNPKFL